MQKILVTGGSGFIGTNLIEYFIKQGKAVCNFDIKSPKIEEHKVFWNKGDICIKEELEKCIKEFNPDYVVHLAARTDLNENKSLDGYSANILGVKNIVEMINNSPKIKRAIYASSRMVCKIDYVPKNFDDFCPPNLYGESKKIGEIYVKENATHSFVVIRPTSIWGPYFEIPYRTFFDTIKSKTFFLPKGHNPEKSFGFVGNSVFQIEKLLFEETKTLNKVYYLTDYPTLKLKTWADLISNNFHNNDVKTIPFYVLKIISKIGDVLQKIGWYNVPLTSFRLNNLITNMVYDTKELEEVCGKLPFTLEEGVTKTIGWMKKA